MAKVNIETLMDYVQQEIDAYADYHEKARNLCRGGSDDYARRKKALQYAEEYSRNTRDSVMAITEVLGMNADQVARMYIAGRATRKWHEKTHWEKLIPEGTKKRIERYIFGPPEPPTWWCRNCVWFDENK